MIIASTIGSCYVIILYVTKNNIFSSIISKIILSIIIVYVTFNPQSAGKMWKQVLIFYLTSFVFGGISLYLIYFSNLNIFTPLSNKNNTITLSSILSSGSRKLVKP